MKTQAAKKPEIYLLLALRQTAARSVRQTKSDAPEDCQIEETALPENENLEMRERIFSAFSEQLDTPQAEKFERLRSNYQSKPEAEKQKWRERVQALIRQDADNLIDDAVHFSHVEAAIKREIPPIQKIIASALSPDYRNLLAPNVNEAENDEAQNDFRLPARLERTVCKAFAAQFVALRDLPDARVFDRLNGAQTARLARFAGIREVAVACAGIKAVEAVAGFLRRFAPEDARAIAAQLSGLPEISGERLAFAENLVQSALENEPKPTSAILDWLGLRLIGIMLGAGESAARVRYAGQKLPLETEPKLSEIVDTQRRNTPDALLREIAAEIERLAETVADSGAKTK